MSYTVYKIGFNDCPKVYIGATGNFGKRKSNHLFNLANNRHPNKDLQLAYAQYGVQNIFFEALQIINNGDKDGEKNWIQKIGIENCFNKNDGSECGTSATGISITFTASPAVYEWLQNRKKEFGLNPSAVLNSLCVEAMKREESNSKS